MFITLCYRYSYLMCTDFCFGIKIVKNFLTKYCECVGNSATNVFQYWVWNMPDRLVRLVLPSTMVHF